MKTYYARIRFKEDILGTSPADPKIQEKFVSSKIPDTVIDPDTQKQAEIAGVTAAEAIEKSMTVFYRNQDGQPILMPYQVAGFLKSAAKAINGEAGRERRQQMAEQMTRGRRGRQERRKATSQPINQRSTNMFSFHR